MFTKRLTQEDLNRTRREAVAEATVNQLRTDFQSHCVNCDKYKESQQLQHKENQGKFDRINRVIWIATGAWGAIALLSKIAEVFLTHFK